MDHLFLGYHLEVVLGEAVLYGDEAAVRNGLPRELELQQIFLLIIRMLGGEKKKLK